MKKYLALVGLLILVPMPALAQFRLPIPRVPVPIPEIPVEIPGLDNLLEEEPSISTNLEDAQTAIALLDEFNPQSFTSMLAQPRGENGSFLLRPGLYLLNAQSYCLHAGTYAPGGGEGYLYAPLQGKRADMIRHILQNSVDHPDISQGRIQILLWAIQSRTRFGDMPEEIQAAARQLLTEDEIDDLNGDALDLIPASLRREVFAQFPPAVRQVLNAEAELRQMLTQGNTSLEELSRVAVLTGNPEQGEGSQAVPTGRWSWHPDGFFVRYFPSGHSETQIQVYVPERYTIERDALGRITAIADTQGNQTEVEYDDTIPPQAAPNDPTLVAYAFKTIRLTRPNAALPGGIEQVELQNTGWTFVQQTSVSAISPLHLTTTSAVNKSNPISVLAQAGSRFDDLLERLEQANQWREDVEAAKEEFDQHTNPPTSEDIDNLLDPGHLMDGIEAAGGDSLDRLNWWVEHYQRILRAIAYTVAVIETLPNQIGQTVEFDPSGQIAVPSDTSRQRLGQSGRSDDDIEDIEPYLDLDENGLPQIPQIPQQ
jgi:YD repeat-containing protein